MQAVWLWSRQLRIQQPTATGNYAAIGRFWSVPYRSSRSTKAQWSGRRLGDKVKIAGRKWIGRVENKREPPYVPPVVLTTGLYCTVLVKSTNLKFSLNKRNWIIIHHSFVLWYKWSEFWNPYFSASSFYFLPPNSNKHWIGTEYISYCTFKMELFSNSYCIKSFDWIWSTVRGTCCCVYFLFCRNNTPKTE